MIDEHLDKVDKIDSNTTLSNTTDNRLRDRSPEPTIHGVSSNLISASHRQTGNAEGLTFGNDNVLTIFQINPNNGHIALNIVDSGRRLWRHALCYILIRSTCYQPGRHLPQGRYSIATGLIWHNDMLICQLRIDSTPYTQHSFELS